MTGAVKTLRDYLAELPAEVLDKPIKGFGLLWLNEHNCIESGRSGLSTDEFHHIVGQWQAQWLLSGKPNHDGHFADKKQSN